MNVSTNYNDISQCQQNTKPTTIVRVTDFTGPALTETEDQADALTDKLRNHLKQAIREGKRIHIR